MARKTFEDNLNRLEEIVDEMDSSDLSLDKSLKLYKEGIDLCVSLGASLDKTEQQVRLLKKTAEGIFEKKDFIGEGDS